MGVHAGMDVIPLVFSGLVGQHFPAQKQMENKKSRAVIVSRHTPAPDFLSKLTRSIETERIQNRVFKRERQ